MRVLHIIGSPRGDRSRSRDVAAAFLAALEPAEAAEFDVWREPLPDLGGEMIESRYGLIHGGEVDPAHAAQWAELRALVDRLLSFDLWLFSTPMWNFGLPYRLKQFVDCVIQPTMAFTNDRTGAVTCHGTDKVAVIIAAGALDTRPGGALEALDFTANHLAQALTAYFGVRAAHIVRVMPTFGETAAVEAAVAEARREAEALARRLSAGGDAPD